MKKQMKRTIYEAPRTILYKVEVEGVICGSVDVEAQAPSGGGVSTTDQDVNVGFGSVNDFTNSTEGWD